MTLTIHHLQVSQSERIVWLAEELSLSYQLTLHQRDPLFSPQSIKDLNPLGQAPVIQDGSVTLAESAACADYILQKYDPNNHLHLSPSHPDFASYLYWFHFANGNLQPQFSRIMTLKFANVNMEESYAQRQYSQLDKYLKLMDERVKENEWLAGSDFTAADCMNVFSLTTMRTFHPFDLSEYPNILAYLKRASQRDGYKRARAKGDPDLPLMIEGKAPESFLDRQKAAGRM